jgi:hypothetical protein
VDNNSIQYVVDEEGKQVSVQIPIAQWELIKAQLAYDEETAEGTESPMLVDKQGIIVVRAKALRDLNHITRYERHHRLFELLQRVGL